MDLSCTPLSQSKQCREENFWGLASGTTGWIWLCPLSCNLFNSVSSCVKCKRSVRMVVWIKWANICKGLRIYYIKN